jgi:RimJ/RimL family protein N-acetyltransferase
VRGFDFSPYNGLEERLNAQGIRIVTYADLADNPDRERKLHALDFALLQDMPFGESQTEVPLEQFVAETILAPGFLPEACFIARSGQEWIGYSNLRKMGDFYGVQMTGVRPAWLGRGIATLLKLRGVAYSIAHDQLKLATTNDAENHAMFVINRRMGFQEVGAMLRYKKSC